MVIFLFNFSMQKNQAFQLSQQKQFSESKYILVKNLKLYSDLFVDFQAHELLCSLSTYETSGLSCTFRNRLEIFKIIVQFLKVFIRNMVRARHTVEPKIIIQTRFKKSKIKYYWFYLFILTALCALALKIFWNREVALNIKQQNSLILYKYNIYSNILPIGFVRTNNLQFTKTSNIQFLKLCCLCLFNLDKRFSRMCQNFNRECLLQQKNQIESGVAKIVR
eukprot:TRINITY_DN18411_c0_g1_i2.p2 TRINITY_DN18411_c0_g1~~TRINITY_DN18411_c0_g1_i2.p2  ORF type:complete len:221 (-),score=-12.07 TRINITY_DN18411_c0_g1_i2:843-1505(-)